MGQILELTFEIPSSPLPELFGGSAYHYCDDHALIGILNDQGLRASAIRSLNDKSELEHGRRLIRKVWQEDSGQFHDPDLEERVARVLDIADNLLDEDTVFVACASERPDDLGQFRNYGSNALEIDASKTLWPSTNTFGFPDSLVVQSVPIGWRRVLYAKRAKMKAIRAFLRKVAEEAQRLHAERGWEPSPNELLTVTFAWWYRNLVPLLKHKAFEQEREVRLVVLTQPRFIDLHFRPSAYGVVPFVLTTRVAVDDGSAMQFPLTGLRIGPVLHPDTAERGARMLLGQRGYPSSVKISKMPYRPA